MKYFIFLLIMLNTCFIKAVEIFSTHRALTLYQPTQELIKIEAEKQFWNNKLKLQADNPAFLQMSAASYSASFSSSGNIHDLKKAEALLIRALAYNKTSRRGILRDLAACYISQHRFCEALNQLVEASAIGREKRATALMLFDVFLEIGSLDEAKTELTMLSEITDFNYLIRLAKWEDHQGNLSEAIKILEIARIKAESGKDKSQMHWIYSNLGDFYGHDAQFENSAKYYLKSLQLNAGDWYSLKGLAWMIWSKDQNSDIALKMLETIKLYSKDPGVELLIASLLEDKGDHTQAEQIRFTLKAQLSQAEYSLMYSQLLFEQFIKDSQFAEAEKLAYQEIDSRPVPSAYIMLAELFKAQSKEDQAIEILLNHVINKTEEPSILLKAHAVLSNNKLLQHDLENKLKSAWYELGPLDRI